MEKENISLPNFTLIQSLFVSLDICMYYTHTNALHQCFNTINYYLFPFMVYTEKNFFVFSVTLSRLFTK